PRHRALRLHRGDARKGRATRTCPARCGHRAYPARHDHRWSDHPRTLPACSRRRAAVAATLLRADWRPCCGNVYYLTSRSGVLRIEKRPDGALQLAYTAMRPTPDLLRRQFREPALHEVQPRAIGGCEVHVKPGTLGEPRPDERCFVRSVIVHDEVDVPIGWYA